MNDDEKTPTTDVQPVAAFAAECPVCGRTMNGSVHPPPGMTATSRVVADEAPHPADKCGSKLVVTLVRRVQ